MTEYYRPIQMRKSGMKVKVWVGVVFGLTGLISLALWGWGRRGGSGSVFGEMKISYVYERENKVDIPQEIKELAEGGGKYGVYVYRIDKKTGYGFNEDVRLPIMSIAKVPIMVAGLREVDDGRMKLESTYTVMVEVEADEEETATAAATPKLVATKMTLEKMMAEMGKRSNNAAAAALSKAVGKEKIAETMEILGMEKSDFGDNSTTARDVGEMFKRLEENEGILSEESRELLFTSLQDSIYEDRIAVGLPKGTQLVHKVGTDTDVWSDAGVVGLTDPFVLVILNDGVEIEEAKKTVPKITEIIWAHEAGN